MYYVINYRRGAGKFQQWRKLRIAVTWFHQFVLCAVLKYFTVLPKSIQVIYANWKMLKIRCLHILSYLPIVSKLVTVKEQYVQAYLKESFTHLIITDKKQESCSLFPRNLCKHHQGRTAFTPVPSCPVSYEHVLRLVVKKKNENTSWKINTQN